MRAIDLRFLTTMVTDEIIAYHGSYKQNEGLQVNVIAQGPSAGVGMTSCLRRQLLRSPETADTSDSPCNGSFVDLQLSSSPASFLA